MPGGHPRRTVVLSDPSDEDDESVAATEPSAGDAAVTSTRDLEEEERLACLDAERRSKHNAEQSSRCHSTIVRRGEGPMGETSAPMPFTSAIPSKRGWVESDAS
jgi:hypothetical protein